MPSTPTQNHRWTPRRIAGIAIALLAAVLLSAGGALLWADGKKDADGYFTTAREPFASSTYALATDNLGVDLDGVEWLMRDEGLGDVRIDVQPQDGKPLFVGIAPTRDVEAYLSGTPHTEVTDVEYSPFHASYRERDGARRPAPPAGQSFWAASAHGAGTQTVRWDLEDGDWSIVVMNEDGSRTVGARIAVGAKVPFIAPAGWAALGGGLLLLVLAAALLFRPSSRNPQWSSRPQPAS